MDDQLRMDGQLLGATDHEWHLHPSRWRVVKTVGNRLVPTLIEATLIPTVLFYAVLASTRELVVALLTGLAWSYVAVLRRLLRGREVPALLILTSLGVTIRTIVFLFSGNAFVYFAQPILGTVVTSLAFGVSVLVGRPLIARFAGDFCTLSVEVSDRPAVARLFRRLTLLWAVVNLTSAAVSVVLLVTLPVGAFVGSRTVAMWAITSSGVVATVWESVRVCRREGLATAVGPNGVLRAYVGVPLGAAVGVAAAA
jgi:hypothetical protein